MTEQEPHIESLPVIAGGSPLPGDRLLASAGHMPESGAEFVKQWVADWREFDQRTGATEPY